MLDARHPSPRLAMALVVRDEAQFLEANLVYHKALGVSRAYIYLDRCTDTTPEIAAACAWAIPIRRDRDPLDHHMSSFQTRCLDDALVRARADGFDWLLHLDPDEFAWGDNRPGLWQRLSGRGRGMPIQAVGSLTAMLNRVGPSIEMILMRGKEVVPLPVEPGTPFWKLPYFQDRGIFKRPVLDPTTGVVRQLDLWIGGHRGKSIVRLSAAVQAASAHHWVRAENAGERPLKSKRLGFHYHYVVVDSEQWRAKYRKFAEYPDHWSSGRPVRFPKQAWKEASLRLNAEEARRYYDEWVAVSPAELARRVDGRRIVRESFVEEILALVYDPARPADSPAALP